jgi:hypothetical protein
MALWGHPSCAAGCCFRGKSGHPLNSPPCPLMTQSRRWPGIGRFDLYPKAPLSPYDVTFTCGWLHMKRRARAGSKIAKARRRKTERRSNAPHRVDHRAPPDATLREQLDQSRHELKEALEHQAATSEVLDLISRTPTNVQPVFDAIIDSAVHLCDAVFGGGLPTLRSTPPRSSFWEL